MKTRVNAIAVFVAAIVHFALGAAWFTVFAKPWIAGTGMTPEQVQYYQLHPAPMNFVIALLCNIVMAYAVAWVIGEVYERNVLRGISVGAVLGVLAAMAMLTEQTFEMRPLVFKLIAAGYPFVGCIIMGAILGAWKQKQQADLVRGARAK